MYCLLIPGLSILAFVAYQSMKLMRFQDSARKVKARVSWLPGGKEFEHHYKRKDGVAMLRDKEFVRRHKYALWVTIPQPDGEFVECGLTGGRNLKLKHGDTLEVLYSPLQPESVSLPGEDLGSGLIVVGVFGFILTVLAYIAVVNSPR